MQERRGYRYRGENLDLELELWIGGGLRLNIRVLSKKGEVLEDKSIEFSEATVREWIRLALIRSAGKFFKIGG